MPNLKNKVVTYMTLSADASTCNSPSQVYAKKSDANSRYLVVRIVDANGNIDVQGNAQLNATKPDGTHVYVGGDTNDDGTVTILLKSSVLALDGKVSCDITVFDKEDNETVILTTSTFFILVADSNYKADALESTNEFSMSAEMIAQVAEDRRTAEQARDEAGEALMNIENIVSQGGLANALKGNASGEAVRVDDVSPLARDIVVKVSGVEDVSAVKVQKNGKNLFNVFAILGGPGLVNLGDGTLKVTASATSAGMSTRTLLREAAPSLRVGKTYTLTATTTGTSRQIYLAGCAKTWFFGQSLKMTESLLNSRITFYASGLNTSAIISEIQIEEGSTPTDNEPYVEPTEYAVNEDGTVSGVTALTPTTTLTTDTAGAVIDATYNRDANKVVAELVSRIAALESAVLK